jgi:hypothetical protein
VWIVDTHANKPVAQRLWRERPDENQLTGITTFNDLPYKSAEDLLLGELGVIDLHHGSHSANPPYTVAEVFGTALSTRAKTALAEYGFTEFGEKPTALPQSAHCRRIETLPTSGMKDSGAGRVTFPATAFIRT